MKYSDLTADELREQLDKQVSWMNKFLRDNAGELTAAVRRVLKQERLTDHQAELAVQLEKGKDKFQALLDAATVYPELRPKVAELTFWLNTAKRAVAR